MSIKSLIINPGSTSTKIGVFEDETLLFEETLRHSTEEISQYATIADQKDFRKKIITDLLEEKQFDIKSLNVVVGRGGMLKPIPGGTYAVTDDLLADLVEIGSQIKVAQILAAQLNDVDATTMLTENNDIEAQLEKAREKLEELTKEAA